MASCMGWCWEGASEGEWGLTWWMCGRWSLATVVVRQCCVSIVDGGGGGGGWDRVEGCWWRPNQMSAFVDVQFVWPCHKMIKWAEFLIIWWSHSVAVRMVLCSCTWLLTESSVQFSIFALFFIPHVMVSFHGIPWSPYGIVHGLQCKFMGNSMESIWTSQWMA